MRWSNRFQLEGFRVKAEVLTWSHRDIVELMREKPCQTKKTSLGPPKSWIYIQISATLPPRETPISNPLIRSGEFRAIWQRTHGSWTTQFLLQSARECPGYTRLSRYCHINGAQESEQSYDKGGLQFDSVSRCSPGINFSGEETEGIIVLVDGLAVVPSFLFVPPVTVRIAEGAFLWRRIDVAAVLWEVLVGVFMAERGVGYLAWIYNFGVDGGSETGCEGEGAVD